ncbi:MAG: LysR family transcriptional regulator [Sphingobium sp.]|jgi:DNA-binding transcriptional LysR family regulator|nr:LysR family transcriptional regulator [Sphingobium sp.]MCP5397942.1 LysR family transcriptional regulator [Sphingomonas sp.]
MIDRYLLRYFLAVVDQGNFSRAAAQCRVSQPTLSVGIAKLERELGTTLFERSSRRVELTREGVRFLGYAGRIEREFLAAETLGEAGSRELLRLGVLTTLPATWVERMIEKAGVNWLGGGLEIVEGKAGELRSKLERGRIDAAVTLVETETADAEPLYREKFGVAVNISHPLAGADSLSAEQVADHVMLVRRQCEMLSATSRHFTMRGIRPFMAAKTMNDERALAMVRAGLAVTVAPQSYSGNGIMILPMAGFDVERTIGIMHGTVGGTMLHPASREMLQRMADSLTGLARDHSLQPLVPVS